MDPMKNLILTYRANDFFIGGIAGSGLQDSRVITNAEEKGGRMNFWTYDDSVGARMIFRFDSLTVN